MTLFKGELTYDEMIYGRPKKRLIELRDTRVERLTNEQKELEKLQKDQEAEQARAAREQERMNARNQILAGSDG